VLTGIPTLLQIGFVRIQFAPFARPNDFGEARRVDVASNGVTMQPNERCDSNLTCALLMERDHFVIATFAPRSPALALGLA